MRPAHSHADGQVHDHDHGDGSGADHTHGWDLDVTDDPTAPTVFFANDVVEFDTVGIDVGSSTTHVMFGHVRLERLAQSLSSRFVVTQRATTWQSPILLTPYAADDTIDADGLRQFFVSCFDAAGLQPSDVDTGVIILTGEALKRRNARAIASLFADTSGRFVCALAGHHREASMAALGSGAAPMSRSRGDVILNVDVGGGTTKLALLADGEILHTAAFAVGGRLLVRDEAGRAVLVAEPMRTISEASGVTVVAGMPLTDDEIGRIVAAMVDAVVEHVRGDAGPLAEALLVTAPLPLTPRPTAVTFSGGVSEYVYGREEADFGDLGQRLGTGLRIAAEEGRIGYPLLQPEQGIRATAVGLSQFSVQVSGNTISVSAEGGLPLRNVPVVRPRLELKETVDPDAVAAAVNRAVAQGDSVPDGPLAVAVAWAGDPEHARLAAMADGLRSGVAETEWAAACPGAPLVLLLDADLGRSFGRLFAEEVDLGRPVVCLDGIEVEDCDYVDIGSMIMPGRVVPVIVKSLLFDAGAR
jgi:ethanolamine utilization protein EutA